MEIHWHDLGYGVETGYTNEKLEFVLTPDTGSCVFLLREIDTDRLYYEMSREEAKEAAETLVKSRVSA